MKITCARRPKRPRGPHVPIKKAVGAKHYLGRLCKHDHDHEGTGQSMRYAKNGGCMECERIRAREYMAKNRAEDPEFVQRQREADCRYRATDRGRKKHRENTLAAYHRRMADPEGRDKQQAYWRAQQKTRHEERRKYERERRKRDPAWRIKCRIQAQVRYALKYYTETGKTRSTSEYGIDLVAIVHHLMVLHPCPGNMDDYHVDHIKPQALFDMNDPEQVKQAWAIKNLQWLSAHENRVKWSHYDGD